MASAERTLGKGVEPRLAEWLSRFRTRSALDLGCGYGHYLNTVMADYRVGIDAHGPYISEAKRLFPGTEFICGDMRDWRELTQGMEFDHVQMIDSLEHLSKFDATALLEDLVESVRRVVLFVPIGHHPQEPCDGNEHQRHLSEWTADELHDLGFTISMNSNYHGSGDSGAAAMAVRDERWISHTVA